MSIEERMANLYLCLGVVAGTLIDKDAMGALEKALRRGELHADYVRVVRDKLSQALESAPAKDAP